MKISIITPTLNSEKYIHETLTSIKKACRDLEFEHIVVDGGSKDKTKEIIIENGISKYFELVGSSMYEAIDYGFKKSTGNILCWLNSDDLFSEKNLGKVLEIFEENNAVNVITGNCSYINNKSEIIYNYRFPYIHSSIFLSFKHLYICQPATFWKRSVYFELGGFNFDYKISSDRDFFFRCRQKYNWFYSNYNFSSFRLHESNLSVVKHAEAQYENNQINNNLHVGPITLLRKVLSVLGHIYMKLRNLPAMYYKLKIIFKKK